MGIDDFDYNHEVHGFEPNNNDEYDFGARELAEDIGLNGETLRSPSVSKLMRKFPR
ncbi:hypothetical protein HOE04_03780 [archaeon]|jgi:hypothetical protein|nr:hypothetical protein [archaeon]